MQVLGSKCAGFEKILQLFNSKLAFYLDKMDAKMIMSAVRKEWSIDEKIIKTKNNVKVELTTKGKYELLRIHGHRGYVDFFEIYS